MLVKPPAPRIKRRRLKHKLPPDSFFGALTTDRAQKAKKLDLITSLKISQTYDHPRNQNSESPSLLPRFTRYNVWSPQGHKRPSTKMKSQRRAISLAMGDDSFDIGPATKSVQSTRNPNSVRSREIKSRWQVHRPSSQINRVANNIVRYTDSVYQMERRIDKQYKPLAKQDMYDLLARYKFPRPVLHKLYGQYKTYLNIAKVRNPKADIQQGIDRETFMQCMGRGANQAVLERVFDAIDSDNSGHIDWKEFLQAMSTVRCGTQEDKLTLFFNLFDKDGNGALMFDEIVEMCKINLKADINSLDGVVDDISDYFARKIYSTCDKPHNAEISLNDLKAAVLHSGDDDMFALFAQVN